MKVDGIDNLEFENDWFIHRGETYRYDDVVDINFMSRQTRHSVNLVPTGTSYDTKLLVGFASRPTLHFSVSERPIFKHQDVKDRVSAIWRIKGGGSMPLPA